MSRGQHIQVILLLIQASKLEPEDRTPNKTENPHSTIIPHEQWISRQRDEGLANGGGDGGLEEEDRHDEGPHVLWRLGERVLEACDRSQDLRDGDEDVRARLRPDIDADRCAGRDAVCKHARRKLPAFGLLVDVSLNDGRPDHGHGAGVEAPGDLLDGREFDVHLAEVGPQEEVADRDQDDEREGVEIREHVVRQPV